MVDQIGNFVIFLPAGIDFSQRIVSMADVGADGDGIRENRFRIVCQTGIQKQIGPLLQGTHQYGVILIIPGQRCNVRSAVFQLEVGIGEACEIYDRLCRQRSKETTVFFGSFVVRKSIYGKLIQGDFYIVQII